MTMKIEYEITVQDDLDAEQTYREWKFSQALSKWIFRGFVAYMCIVSFYVIQTIITNFSEPESVYIFWLGLFNLVVGILCLYVINPKFIQSQWNKQATAKGYEEYYLQRNTRSIIITEQEFIFTTQNSEEAWKWQALNYLYEGTNGFMLSFFSGQNIFVSKRGFTERSQIAEFKSLIELYSDGA